MKGRIRRILASLYDKHIYLLNTLSPAKKRYFNLILNGSADSYNEATLQILSEYLKIYYNHRCIVLIDEYDHPLDIAFQYEFYEKARNCFSALLGGLLKVSILNSCC